MASEAQIRANRQNALRSTGPRTAAGKAISSRNAFRHGLSMEFKPDAKAVAGMEALAEQIAGPENMEEAKAFASAHFEIGRIEEVRRQMLARLDLADAKPEELRYLCAVDRYQFRARTKRRRASSKMRRFNHKSDSGT
jgi:hypothetical protein